MRCDKTYVRRTAIAGELGRVRQLVLEAKFDRVQQGRRSFLVRESGMSRVVTKAKVKKFERGWADLVTVSARTSYGRSDFIRDWPIDRNPELSVTQQYKANKADVQWFRGHVLAKVVG